MSKHRSSFNVHSYLWLTDLDELRRWPRLALHSVRRLFMAVELFINNNLSSHAAALTYSSVLGAVPILAIVFAISRGFGFERLIAEKLAENVRFTPEMTQMLMDFVNSYLERAKGGVFIGVGLIMLLYTLINLISSIETSFNTIWRVSTSRNIYRRVVNYVSIFVLLPLVIVVTSGLQIFLMGIGNFLPDFTFVSDSIQLLVELTPYALSCLAFILLYKLMPNTDVRWAATFVPGILAGLAFQALQWFYIHSQVWLSTYNAVYGSFAAIPLFMLWMQLSWTICLFGGQLSYAHQMEADFAFEKAAPHLSRRSHDRVALDIMHRLCAAFDHGQAMTAAELAEEAHLPLSLVNSILYELTADTQRPLVNEVLRGKRSTPYFQPATNTATLTDDIILDYFYHLGDDIWHE